MKLLNLIALASVSVVVSSKASKGAVNECHFHDDKQVCVDENGHEGTITPSPKSKDDAPAEYSSCHKHGDDTFCKDQDGNEVQFKIDDGKFNVTGCHFHGGKQMCKTEDGDEGEIVPSPKNNDDAPKEYSGCHEHEGEGTFCKDGDGNEVQFKAKKKEEQKFSVSGCHFHGDKQMCKTDDGEEGEIVPSPKDNDSAPKEYSGCHEHKGEGTFCKDSEGNEVQFKTEGKKETFDVSGCHFHGSKQFCLTDDGEEGQIMPAPKSESDAPTKYTGCHKHGEDTFCKTNDGEEVEFKAEETTGEHKKGGKNCHFHAGVEHCIDEGESEAETGTPDSEKCKKIDRDYNIPLRIGLLFVILATSAIGVYGPMIARSFFKVPTNGFIFTIIKQFGTGVIISTAFVHLMTHASLMWGNDCLGELKYEATSSAITMAGLFIAFFLEYLASRLTKKANTNNSGTSATNHSEDEEKQQNANVHTHNVEEEGLIHPNEKISVTMMEAGIIFHSILIGITLVVAGDSFFITLFIVIIFHQMFEGLALGARISTLTSGWMVKFFMGLAFSLITLIGMAIGTGVLTKFNGNDPSTIIALGTLDAFSAGVLLWTGLVEMWAYDWIYGYLSRSNWFITICAFVSLLAGMVLMSLLGKWA